MVHTQILVDRGGGGGEGKGQERGFWYYFANGLNQSLVSPVYDNDNRQYLSKAGFSRPVTGFLHS